MTFKVGDVCVVLSAVRHPERAGLECVVVRPNELYTDGDTGEVNEGFGIEIRGVPNPPTGCWRSAGHRLRLKRPKDDAEPRSDFTPCDEDFSEWMKKLGRVGA